jgi:hypothetical protein
MPEQPDDPIHYNMKVPPEPQDATLNKQEQHTDSDEQAPESNPEDNSNPSPPRARP